jgi:hypothetical protein
MRKPNAIWHMIRWGIGSGTILAMLYIIFMGGLGSNVGVFDILKLLIEPSFWWISFIVGGGAGAILGLLDGLMLWALTRKSSRPFTRATMQAIRYRIYGAVGITTTIAGFMLTALVFGSSGFYYTGFLLLFPPFIAGIAAAYAAHRYLFRLRLWSERIYGAQKEKVKNVERLENKPKNDTIYDDNDELEASRHETS